MTTPKPKCRCRICGIQSEDALRAAYMRIISGSYDREELKRLVAMGRATLLPKDPT